MFLLEGELQDCQTANRLELDTFLEGERGSGAGKTGQGNRQNRRRVEVSIRRAKPRTRTVPHKERGRGSHSWRTNFHTLPRRFHKWP